jgi:hypothetical protein
MAGKARGGDDWTLPLPVRRVERSPYAALPDDQWPLTIPAVAHVMREGLDLAPATILVGENGSGKSTLVEAVAIAYGLSREGTGCSATWRTTPAPPVESASHRSQTSTGSATAGPSSRCSTPAASPGTGSS